MGIKTYIVEKHDLRAGVDRTRKRNTSFLTATRSTFSPSRLQSQKVHSPESDTLLSDLGLIAGIEETQVVPERALVDDCVGDQRLQCMMSYDRLLTLVITRLVERRPEDDVVLSSSQPELEMGGTANAP